MKDRNSGEEREGEERGEEGRKKGEERRIGRRVKTTPPACVEIMLINPRAHCTSCLVGMSEFAVCLLGMSE